MFEGLKKFRVSGFGFRVSCGDRGYLFSSDISIVVDELEGRPK
jgi:hypothetical protein